MSFESLHQKVVEWGKERGLYTESDITSQYMKLDEEFDELWQAIAQSNMPETIDAIGDMMVVLTGMAQMAGTNLLACYEAAYHEIKDRKGKMVDGMFVKEETL